MTTTSVFPDRLPVRWCLLARIWLVAALSGPAVAQTASDLFAVGAAKLQQHKFKEALADFDRAVQLDPSRPRPTTIGAWHGTQAATPAGGGRLDPCH